MQRRVIDGVEMCVLEEYPSQTLYGPCPPQAPTTAAVLGVGSIAILAVAWVAWLAPEIEHRRTQLDRIIAQAKRSLDDV